MIDLPDDMNAEVYSSEYRWTECSDCGVSLRAPVYDPDPVMCSHCADPYPETDERRRAARVGPGEDRSDG